MPLLICLKCGGARVAVDTPCAGCGEATGKVDGFYSFAPRTARAGAGFDPERFAFLSRIQDGNFWFRGRNELIAWTVKRCFPEARSLLEIGCGSGAVLAHLQRGCPQLERLAGADAHVEALGFAAARVGDGVRLFQVEATRLPWREEYDVVGAFDVIEHVRDDVGALAELRSAVRAGGGLLVTVPQHPWLWSRHDEVARHVRRYRGRELTRRLQAAGFRIVMQSSFVSLLLPVMLASRYLERSRPRPETEGLVVSGIANRCLYLAMRVERALIELGGRFPIGGSLIVAARRV